MPVCTKCNIDKPIEQYALDKQPNKVYRKKYCLDCFRKQARDWKARNKLKTQPIPEPVIPDDWKKCSDCMEFKPLDGFYLNAYGNHIKRCKACHVKMHREKVEYKFRENGGKDQYFKECDRYTTKEQRDQIFMVMEALGWTYYKPSENNIGVWWKKGIKELVDGNIVWPNIILTNKPKRKSPAIPHGRKIKSGVWNNVEKIVKLIEEGYTYNDVADTFDCSHTTIRTVVSNYKNGKKP